jgi:hypothetical protein
MLFLRSCVLPGVFDGSVAGGSAAKAAREPRKTWNFIPCFTRRSLVAFAGPPVSRQKIYNYFTN